MKSPSLRAALAACVFAVAWGASLLAEDAPPKIAVTDFVDAQGTVSEDGKLVALMLVAELSSKDGLALLERSQFSKIMKERGLNASGLANPKEAIQFGALAGAGYVVSGRLCQLGDELCVNGKLVSCEDSSVQGLSESYEMKEGKGKALKNYAGKLAEYIEKRIGERRKAKGEKPRAVPET